eukprot:21010-Heterococcus_DN1.PRE.1
MQQRPKLSTAAGQWLGLPARKKARARQQWCSSRSASTEGFARALLQHSIQHLWIEAATCSLCVRRRAALSRCVCVCKWQQGVRTAHSEARSLLLSCTQQHALPYTDPAAKSAAAAAVRGC